MEHLYSIPSPPKAQGSMQKRSQKIARARGGEDSKEMVFFRPSRAAVQMNSQLLRQHAQIPCKFTPNIIPTHREEVSMKFGN